MLKAKGQSADILPVKLVIYINTRLRDSVNAAYSMKEEYAFINATSTSENAERRIENGRDQHRFHKRSVAVVEDPAA